MNYRIMSVDPGTINTGVVVTELGPDDTLKVLKTVKINKRKDDAWHRVTYIVAPILELILEYEVQELWVELYIPYGARKGSLWNMMLVGALIYLPVTRGLDTLTSYGLYAREWKGWLKKATPNCDKDSRRVVEFAVAHDVVLDDEAHYHLSDPHVSDALGLVLFTRYSGDTNEHPTCDPSL